MSAEKDQRDVDFSELLPAEASSIGYARRRCRDVALALGASADLAADVELAVSEAVTNAVRHGSAHLDSGQVVLAVEHLPGLLAVTVADDGPGLSGAPPSPGLGMGLVIMEQLTAELRVVSGADAGTSVRLVFRLPGD